MTKKFLWLTLGSLAALCLLAAPVTAGAEARGNLRVVVVGHMGAPLAQAGVMLVGPERQRNRETGFDGVVEFPLIPQGVYEVQVIKAKMQRVVRTGVVVRQGQTMTLRIEMRPQGQGM
ncbi:MAG: carboxypeptidase-like regulatory domain-containing protein [Desulfarculaceae bacterium]|nr:carboxypeptidase-like regulatory domain-containing protein [Desulfarculaceae bacterium]